MAVEQTNRDIIIYYLQTTKDVRMSAFNEKRQIRIGHQQPRQRQILHTQVLEMKACKLALLSLCRDGYNENASLTYMRYICFSIKQETRPICRTKSRFRPTRLCCRCIYHLKKKKSLFSTPLGHMGRILQNLEAEATEAVVRAPLRPT